MSVEDINKVKEWVARVVDKEEVTITKDNGTSHRCINSDFLKVMGLPKVGMVLTDTPFGTTRCKWDSVINLPHMWSWLEPLRSPRTPVLLFSQLPYDKVLGSSNLKDLRYEWIWEKTSATGHLNAKKMPMKCHENILTFYEKLPVYNYEKTKGHTRKTAIKGEHLQSDVYNYTKNNTSYDSTERYPRDVLKYPSDKQKLNLNSTQKPLALLRYLIRTYTNVGDTVLDFTAGSFATAVACYLEGRNSIVIEMDEEQFNKSLSWIKNCSFEEHYCTEV